VAATGVITEPQVKRVSGGAVVKRLLCSAGGNGRFWPGGTALKRKPIRCDEAVALLL